MVLGLVIILLACVLNVMLLAIPLVLLVWFADWATELMKKLHWIGPRGADVVYLAILVFTLLPARRDRRDPAGDPPGAHRLDQIGTEPLRSENGHARSCHEMIPPQRDPWR